MLIARSAPCSTRNGERRSVSTRDATLIPARPKDSTQPVSDEPTSTTDSGSTAETSASTTTSMAALLTIEHRPYPGTRPRRQRASQHIEIALMLLELRSQFLDLGFERTD